MIEGSDYVTLKNPFVIIPQQMGPGKPVQLMMSLYNAFGKGDKVEVAKDKVVFMTDPKDEIKILTNKIQVRYSHQIKDL